MKKKLLLALTLVLSGTLMSQAGPADKLKVPGPDANGRRGATVPYNRYEAENGELSGGAAKKTTSYGRKDIATQASKQSYVDLSSKGSAVNFKIDRNGDGVTMRFTMKDSPNGMGENGSLDVYVNGNKDQTVKLTSYFMWQYFNLNDPYPKDVPGGDFRCFAFDEVHFKLNNKVKPGDVITVKNDDSRNMEYGLDFIEVENVPAKIKQPAGSISIQDTKYKNMAAGGDWGDAFIQAVKDAEASPSRTLYIPAGTYNLGKVWRIFADNVTITGAGMWYTNIKFTNPNKEGGGISGGNGSHGPDGYSKKIEFCNMYINSALRSRMDQMAIYKCFMDVYTDGSYFHDIWEEHFECGFWIGDYNGKMDYSDGIKIANCRIRNNLADGVNFAQGTSNATVYNCSVRGNGDDGLATWNQDACGARDLHDNIFAYNTVELGWRAGGIAVYGGTGHRIYNNFVTDMALAAGIHLNSTFPGTKFNANNKPDGIKFENNTIVRSGTNCDIFGNDLAALDVHKTGGSLQNITFYNTEIYDAPCFGITVLNDPDNIKFINTKILGAGLTGMSTSYSTTPVTFCAIRADQATPIFDGLEIGNVHKDVLGNNQTWPLWTNNNHQKADAIKYTNIKKKYVAPEPPYADKDQQGGIIDPMDGLSGYNVKLEGISWKNAKGNSDLKEGDVVTFRVKITNTSNVDIPKDVALAFEVKVNGESAAISDDFEGGLKAGKSVILTANGSWIAKLGVCKVEAIADPENNLPKEISKDDNKRVKQFNVYEAPDNNGTFTPVTGGYDLVVTKILMNTKSIKPGDKVNFSAIVANAGDQDAPAGDVLGIQFQIDGKTEVITWSDDYRKGVKSHEFVKVTANGGTAGKEWTATEGKHTVTAWIDNYGGRYAGEINHDNNKFTIELNIPMSPVQFINNPDKPDNIDGTDGIEAVNAVQSVKDSYYYDLQGRRYGTTTEGLKKGVYIHCGKKVIIK